MLNQAKPEVAATDACVESHLGTDYAPPMLGGATTRNFSGSPTVRRQDGLTVEASRIRHLSPTEGPALLSLSFSRNSHPNEPAANR